MQVIYHIAAWFFWIFSEIQPKPFCFTFDTRLFVYSDAEVAASVLAFSFLQFNGSVFFQSSTSASPHRRGEKPNVCPLFIPKRAVKTTFPVNIILVNQPQLFEDWP